MADTINSRRHLWHAVIGQALADASSTAKGTISALGRYQARRWLTIPSRDFDEVCALAGEEPDRVRAVALKVIAEADLGGKKLSRNERTVLEHDGLSLTIEEWAARLDMPVGLILGRVRNGWTVEHALTLPRRSKRVVHIPMPTPSLPPARRMRPPRCIQARHLQPTIGKPAKRLTFNGLSLTYAEWGDRVGISPNALHNRLKNGWPLERALTEVISPRARAHRESLRRRREARQR